MTLNLDDLLPEEISDEAASHVANVFMALAVAIENRYYAQIIRHTKATAQRPDLEEPF